MTIKLTDNEVYDRNFASFYSYMLTDQAVKYGKYILNFAKKHNVDNSIIDYMCGTGNLLEIFEKNGWNTTGVDLSPYMLKVADMRLSRTKLLEADVTDLNLKAQYGIATSTTDAINHLESQKMIKNFFKTVWDTLKDNGFFIFDVNTLLGVKRNCSYISDSTPNYISIREGFFDEVHQLGYTRFQGAYKKNNSLNYIRFDSKIYNYVYNIEDLYMLLKDCGFSKINIFDGYSDRPYDPMRTERAVFVCKKEESEKVCQKRRLIKSSHHLNSKRY